MSFTYRTDHKVGDMVKDHFDRVWIVLAEKRNGDGRQYSVRVQYISGQQPYHGETAWAFADNFVEITNANQSR